MALKYFVICYDIANKKRLQKIHKLVSQCLTQLQYSVYYGKMTTQQMDKVIQQIKRIINIEEDDIRVYETQPLSQALIKNRHPNDIMTFMDGERLG